MGRKRFNFHLLQVSPEFLRAGAAIDEYEPLLTSMKPGDHQSCVRYPASLPLIDDPSIAQDLYPGQEDATEAFACAWNLADLRALAPMLADDVQFDSPAVGMFRNGKVEVMGYLQATIEDYAIKRITAYAEMGNFVGEQAGRPCVLLSVNDPNRPIGVMEVSVSEGRIVGFLCDGGVVTPCQR